MTVETGEDGVRAGCPQKVDDYENSVYEDRTPNRASDDAMGRIESRQQSWSEAQGSRTVIDQNNDTVQHISMLCSTVRNLRSQMQETFATERNTRLGGYTKMVQKMSGKLEEGLRSEQQARQQAQNEIMKGLKNEENARQMVQKDLAVMEEEIKNLKKKGSGSTVCSEASTDVGLGASGIFVRPPAQASRYNDVFVPKKMEFKGWVTDYTRSSFQGITLNEVVDLQKMVPNEFHQYIDWNHTRAEQGDWPTKTTVNMWFKNETNLATMIGLLKVVLFMMELKKKGALQNS